MTAYDAIGNTELSARKVNRETGDIVDVIQDGDLVTEYDTRYEDVDNPADGILEQVSESKVGHYVASTGTVNVDCAVTTNITYYDRDDSNSDSIYSWTKSLAPAHDDWGTRAETIAYYDTAGRANMTVDARNNYRTVAYDSMGQVLKTIAWKNNVDPDPDVAVMQRQSVYDNLGRMTRKATMANAADTDGIDTTEDIVTDYIYDYHYPTGGAERDYPGQLVATTIYYGNSSSPATTYYDYDALGRRNKKTDPVGNTTEMVYNSSGQVFRSIRSDLHPTNPSADLTLIEDSYYEYDSSGRIASIIKKPNDASLDVPIYDPSDPEEVAGTMPPITDPLPSSWMLTTYDYDAAGRRVAETKPNGVKTTYSYWAAGQKKTEIADAEGGDTTPDIQQTTKWTYDRVGRLKTIAGNTDQSNPNTWQETYYTYNDLDSVELITYPDSKTIDYDYFANGQVKQRTDQQNIVTAYAYDATGQNLLAKSATVDSVTTTETFTYDAMGRMKTAGKDEGVNPVSDSVFSYYDTGHLESETQKLFGDATGKTVSYTYDTAGYRTSIDYPMLVPNVVRTNTFDGRIDTLSIDGGTNTHIQYHYLGSRVAQKDYYDNSINLLSIGYQYDQYGRIDDIDAGSGYIHFGYAYANKENNIEKKVFYHRDASGNTYNEYAYDDIDRLTGVEYLSDSQDTESFVMDDLGNRAGNQTLRDDGTVNFAVDTETNRYTAVGGSTLAHDDAGNLTTDKDGYVYSYDYENRIVKIEDDQQTLIAEFDYDTQGRRIRVYDAIAGADTYFYYSDDWQVLEEYSDSGFLRMYVYGNYIDEPLLMAGMGGAWYYLQDHLYSTVALLDFNNAFTVHERYEYDAYGKATVWNAAMTATYSASQVDNPYTFTGRRLNALDGGDLLLMYYRHRSYDPYTGRFMQSDPLGYVDGMNLYEYVLSCPVCYLDFSGSMANPIEIDEPVSQVYRGFNPIPGDINKRPTPHIDQRRIPGIGVTAGRWDSTWYFHAYTIQCRDKDTWERKENCCRLIVKGYLDNRWYWAVDEKAEKEELWELAQQEKYWNKFSGLVRKNYKYIGIRVGKYNIDDGDENNKCYRCDFLKILAKHLESGSEYYDASWLVKVNERDMREHPNPLYERSLEAAKNRKDKSKEEFDQTKKALGAFRGKEECCKN